jgi:hypothetical protein
MIKMISVYPILSMNYQYGIYKVALTIEIKSILDPLNLLIFVSSTNGLSLRAKNKSESEKSPNFLLIELN